MLGFYYSFFVKYKQCTPKCTREEVLKLQYRKTWRHLVSDTLPKQKHI
jgi:hypothetical protein